jgi:hypothetical protein
MANGHGGKRDGAGKPKGTKMPATISKEQAREALRQIVLEKMRELTEAQMANAMGIKYLVARQRNSGKFERITESELKAILDGEDDERVLLEVWEKDPSVQAFTDLMNRALDKPKEQEQDVKIDGRIEISWLS